MTAPRPYNLVRIKTVDYRTECGVLTSYNLDQDRLKLERMIVILRKKERGSVLNIKPSNAQWILACARDPYMRPLVNEIEARLKLFKINVMRG
jgi:hypothetical protein